MSDNTSDECPYCRTLPHSNELACRSREEAEECVWFTASDRKALAGKDQEISLVDRLRLGGPNAWEVYGEAADELVRLREYLQAMINADWTLPSSYKNAAREALGKSNQ